MQHKQYISDRHLLPNIYSAAAAVAILLFGHVAAGQRRSAVGTTIKQQKRRRRRRGMFALFNIDDRRTHLQIPCTTLQRLNH